MKSFQRFKYIVQIKISMFRKKQEDAPNISIPACFIHTISCHNIHIML